MVLVEGREAGLFDSKADRKKVWQQYMSTFGQTQQARSSKVEKAPEEIVSRLQSGADRSWWFPIWVKSGKSWANVRYEEVLQKSERERDIDSYEWCTLDQAVEIYKSEVVGTAVCTEAGKNSKSTRRHPSVPWLDAARQYFVPNSSIVVVLVVVL